MTQTDEVRYAVVGACARITLNRPKALNALTLGMVREIDRALNAAEADDAVSTVFLDGTGERGFCAGGDILVMRNSALSGDDSARTFWEEEYRLNARIAGFGLPVVAFMDGVVMGGGIGLAGHASHRVATRSPGELGTHLALTGARVGASDAILAGLADQQVSSEAREALFADLAATGDADAVVARYATPPTDREPPPLAAARPWIDASYAGAEHPTRIVAALRTRAEAEAQVSADAIEQASPTSVSVTLEALRRARRLPTLEACLEQELRVSVAFLGHPDLPEGIRAQVVDKDRRPVWSPDSLDAVSPEDVARFVTGP